MDYKSVPLTVVFALVRYSIMVVTPAGLGAWEDANFEKGCGKTKKAYLKYLIIPLN